jgi:hypothetical protein
VVHERPLKASRRACALVFRMSTSQRPGRVREPPPTTASEGDDGYLTASEIASLKLDADWVILPHATRPLVARRAPKLRGSLKPERSGCRLSSRCWRGERNFTESETFLGTVIFLDDSRSGSTDIT